MGEHRTLKPTATLLLRCSSGHDKRGIGIRIDRNPRVDVKYVPKTKRQKFNYGANNPRILTVHRRNKALGDQGTPNKHTRAK